jgi:hypothetical protein
LLTAEERYLKLLKYYSKRRRRSGKKRVNYVCRKRVADQRIRVNGRFISESDANMLKSSLGISPLHRINEINKLVRHSKEKNLVKLGRKRRKKVIQKPN